MDLMGTFFSRAANCSLESTTAKIIFKKKEYMLHKHGLRKKATGWNYDGWKLCADLT